MIWIGIDPGEHTGLAVWDGQAQRFIRVCTLPLHRAMTLVLNLWEAEARPCDSFHVIFEDARQRKWFARERSTSEYRGKLMGAGAAKRDARIWEEFLSDYGIPFTAQAPHAGSTKWDSIAWQHITGWTGRTSEHARDAAILVFKRR